MRGPGGLWRRGLWAAAAGLALAPAAPARAEIPGPIRFRILREGSAIGTHRVSFAAEPDGALAALTEVEITVRLAGFTVFRFNHRFREVWAGGRLREATSRLDRNGATSEMVARAEGGAILVRGPNGTLRLPGAAAPLTWWEPRRFSGTPLFDNDTGKPLNLVWTRTALPEGGVRWRCTGDSDSEGTYAADGRWIGWTHKAAEDGSTVVYERA